MQQKVMHIMQQLDKWVSSHGSGKYADEDWEPLMNYEIPEDTGIQQVRKEIEEFISFLISKKLSESVLEIGLGYFGSTHFLWRLIFNHVITIEKSHERIRTFGENSRKFYREWVLDDVKSSFLIGMSNDITTVRKAYDHLQDGINLLFLDGDHRYESVLTDWLLYSPLVKSGGVVAFHDCAVNIEGSYGVPQFLEKLSEGQINGKNYNLQRIVCSKNLGIAFYEQT